MKVVIADDNPDILETTAMAIEFEGHECVPAADAAKILEALRAGDVDVLLQDLRMPGLDVETHLATVARECPVPVVIFSAEEAQPALYDLPGVIGFLRKPFDLAELRAALAPLASGRKS